MCHLFKTKSLSICHYFMSCAMDSVSTSFFFRRQSFAGSDPKFGVDFQNIGNGDSQN